MASDEADLPAARPQGSAPGWYPDAKNPYVLYFWDGTSWSSRRERTGDGWTDVPLIDESAASETHRAAKPPAFGSKKFRQSRATPTSGTTTAAAGRTRRSVVMGAVVLVAVAAIAALVVRATQGGGGQPPSPSATSNLLHGVSVTSSSDAWAVGEYTGVHGATATLIERWSTSGWATVASPSQGDRGTLRAVAALSASDAWAVGSYRPRPNSPTRALVLRWDGSSWARVAVPALGGTTSGDTALLGAAGTSSQDAWAVGSITDATSRATTTLILHWNGTAWLAVPSPPAPAGSTHSELTSVDAISSSNAWAVGDYRVDGARWRTVVLHWDGTKWARVPSPNPSSSGSDRLTGVSAAFGTNAWAVGYFGSATSSRTLVLHWNGKSWKQFASPNPSSVNQLNSVSAVSGGDVWAVGTSRRAGSTANVLMAHWDGSTWSQVPCPNGGSGANELDAVDAQSKSSAFTVGSYVSAGVRKLISEHWDGSKWSPT